MKSVLVLFVAIFGSAAYAKTIPQCISEEDVFIVMTQTYTSYMLADFKRTHGQDKDYADQLESFKGSLSEDAEKFKYGIEPILTSGEVTGYKTILSAGGQPVRGMECQDGFIRIECDQTTVTMKLPACWGE